MFKSNLFSLWINLSPYGSTLLHSSLVFKPVAKHKLSLIMAHTLLLKFFIAYASFSGANLNRYFFYLLAQKKAYKIDFAVASLFTYNSAAVVLLKQALFFFLKQLRLSRRVLFIADTRTNKLFNFKRLNYLFWPQYVYPTIVALSDFQYYYNNVMRSSASKFQLSKLGVDCVVFCAEDYSRINPMLFKSFGRALVGVCGADTRPDLFDYTIPVTSTYSFTVSWIVALTLFSKTVK